MTKYAVTMTRGGAYLTEVYETTRASIARRFAKSEFGDIRVISIIRVKENQTELPLWTAVTDEWVTEDN
jgi:osmotically-inducible protein OsmY